MVKRLVQGQTLSNDSDQNVNRDGDPDLSFNGVLICAIEGLDPQMLLDPLERRTDILPIRFHLQKS